MKYSFKIDNYYWALVSICILWLLMFLFSLSKFLITHRVGPFESYAFVALCIVLIIMYGFVLGWRFSSQRKECYSQLLNISALKINIRVYLIVLILSQIVYYALEKPLFQAVNIFPIVLLAIIFSMVKRKSSNIRFLVLECLLITFSFLLFIPLTLVLGKLVHGLFKTSFDLSETLSFILYKSPEDVVLFLFLIPLSFLSSLIIPVVLKKPEVIDEFI